jgi:hypothetical protein
VCHPDKLYPGLYGFIVWKIFCYVKTSIDTNILPGRWKTCKKITFIEVGISLVMWASRMKEDCIVANTVESCMCAVISLL